MIKLDASLLTVDIVRLKTVTTSMGGSITVLDEKRTTAKKEAYFRITVPLSVARSFIMRTKKVTRYLKPVLTAVVRYDNLVVALERHPLGLMGTLEYEGFDGKPRRWEPDCERHLNDIVKPLLNRNDRQWYFDGRYAYAMPSNDVDNAIRTGEYLTRDGRFRKVVVTAVDLQELSVFEKLEPTDRSCLAFVTTRGTTAISPPIWKNLSDVGGTVLKHVAASGKSAQRELDVDDDEEDDDDLVVADADRVYNFDRIDETVAVNLNFALKAGVEIGQTFGYDHVEPLQLPRLMIELHTVNLPNVPKTIKATYDVGIRFTHALAWLLGMSRKANTMETYLMMRSLMKYLTKRGVFRTNTFEAKHVFCDGKATTDVPLLTLNDLLKDSATQLSLSAILDQARMGIKARKRNEQGIHQLGGLLNEE